MGIQKMRSAVIFALLACTAIALSSDDNFATQELGATSPDEAAIAKQSLEPQATLATATPVNTQKRVRTVAKTEAAVGEGKTLSLKEETVLITAERKEITDTLKADLPIEEKYETALDTLEKTMPEYAATAPHVPPQPKAAPVYKLPVKKSKKAKVVTAKDHMNKVKTKTKSLNAKSSADLDDEKYVESQAKTKSLNAKSSAAEKYVESQANAAKKAAPVINQVEQFGLPDELGETDDTITRVVVAEDMLGENDDPSSFAISDEEIQRAANADDDKSTASAYQAFSKVLTASHDNLREANADPINKDVVIHDHKVTLKSRELSESLSLNAGESCQFGLDTRFSLGGGMKNGVMTMGVAKLMMCMKPGAAKFVFDAAIEFKKSDGGASIFLGTVFPGKYSIKISFMPKPLKLNACIAFSFIIPLGPSMKLSNAALCVTFKAPDYPKIDIKLNVMCKLAIVVEGSQGGCANNKCNGPAGICTQAKNSAGKCTEILSLDSEINITPIAIGLEAVMSQTWENAFGVPQMTIGGVSLKAAFTGIIPTMLSFSGRVGFGRDCKLHFDDKWVKTTKPSCIHGQILAGISPVSPAGNYFSAQIGAVTLKELMTWASGGKMGDNVGKMVNALGDTGFPKGMAISFAMKAIEVNGVAIPAGLAFTGAIMLLGVTGSFQFLSSTEVGKPMLEAMASITTVGMGCDPSTSVPPKYINCVVLMARSKAEPTKGPKFDLTINPWIKQFDVNLNAYLSILGISVGTAIKISPSAAIFVIQGSILGGFLTATVRVQIAGMNTPLKAKFQAHAMIQTGSLTKLTKAFAEKFKKVIDAGLKNLKKVYITMQKLAAVCGITLPDMEKESEELRLYHRHEDLLREDGDTTDMWKCLQANCRGFDESRVAQVTEHTAKRPIRYTKLYEDDVAKDKAAQSAEAMKAPQMLGESDFNEGSLRPQDLGEAASAKVGWGSRRRRRWWEVAAERVSKVAERAKKHVAAVAEKAGKHAEKVGKAAETVAKAAEKKKKELTTKAESKGKELATKAESKGKEVGKKVKAKAKEVAAKVVEKALKVVMIPYNAAKKLFDESKAKVAGYAQMVKELAADIFKVVSLCGASVKIDIALTQAPKIEFAVVLLVRKNIAPLKLIIDLSSMGNIIQTNYKAIFKTIKTAFGGNKGVGSSTCTNALPDISKAVNTILPVPADVPDLGFGICMKPPDKLENTPMDAKPSELAAKVAKESMVKKLFIKSAAIRKKECVAKLAARTLLRALPDWLQKKIKSEERNVKKTIIKVKAKAKGTVLKLALNAAIAAGDEFTVKECDIKVSAALKDKKDKLAAVEKTRL